MPISPLTSVDCRSGDNTAHLRVKGVVYKALNRVVTLAGIGCQALPDGATVETGDNDYEPDALVNCG